MRKTALCATEIITYKLMVEWFVSYCKMSVRETDISRELESDGKHDSQFSVRELWIQQSEKMS